MSMNRENEDSETTEKEEEEEEEAPSKCLCEVEDHEVNLHEASVDHHHIVSVRAQLWMQEQVVRKEAC